MSRIETVKYHGMHNQTLIRRTQIGWIRLFWNGDEFHHSVNGGAQHSGHFRYTEIIYYNTGDGLTGNHVTFYTDIEIAFYTDIG